MAQPIIRRTRRWQGTTESSKQKSTWGDGIPREAYKAPRKWGITPIAKIMTEIKEGQAITENWANGAIVYIYKKKGIRGNVGITDQYSSRESYTKYGPG